MVTRCFRRGGDDDSEAEWVAGVGTNETKTSMGRSMAVEAGLDGERGRNRAPDEAASAESVVKGAVDVEADMKALDVTL